MARIVLVTLGSLGDLHPYIAIGAELAARGHSCVLATHEYYRGRVTGAGLDFHAVRPDLSDFGDPREHMHLAMDRRNGSRWVLEHLVLSRFAESCADLLVACTGADLIVSHVITLAAPLVAEKLGIPRVHSVLQPLTMFSCFDPPTLPQLPFGTFARRLGPGAWRVLHALMRAKSRPAFAPVRAQRRAMGLGARAPHPLLQMSSGADGTLALFSRVLSPPQPDWPERTTVTGFCVWDRDEHGGGADATLRAFLDEGEAPLVFTLGSSAVFDAGTFYDVAARATRALGRRAVLLTGPDGINLRPGLSDGRQVLAVPYAPHSEVFPRAAAVVHCGGAGTTGQALAAGRPMLVMPYAHDQPDNAERCRRLGEAHVLPREHWREPRVTETLRALLADAGAARRAAEVACEVRAEGGARTAADALEAALARTGRAG